MQAVAMHMSSVSPIDHLLSFPHQLASLESYTSDRHNKHQTGVRRYEGDRQYIAECVEGLVYTVSGAMIGISLSASVMGLTF